MMSYTHPYVDEVVEINLSPLPLMYFDFAEGDMGTTELSVRAYDGRRLLTSGNYPVYVTPADNALPEITSNPITDILGNTLYSYQLEVVDQNQPAGTAFQYKLETSPAGMTLSETGLLEWAPTNFDIGVHQVQIRVVDELFGFDLQSFYISVLEGPNELPIITAIADQTVRVGIELSLPVSAVDPDNGELILGLVQAPIGMSLVEVLVGDTVQSVIQWLPTEIHLGTQQVELQVVDSGGAAASALFSVQVLPAPTGQPPVFASTPESVVQPGDVYRYLPMATDPDGDVLLFSLTQGPSGMILTNTETGPVVQYISTLDATGVFPITIQVTDGEYVVNQSFELSVVDRVNNSAPAIQSTPGTVAVLGYIYQYQINAVDADGDTLVYSLEVGPTGMTLNDLTGAVAWQPESSDLGLHSVIVRATDSSGAYSEQSFELTVANQLTIQVISTPPTTAIVGEEYVYGVRLLHGYTGDEIVSLPVAPNGMSISPEGIIRWTPDESVAEFVDVEIKVEGFGGQVDTQAFQISTSLGRILNRRVCRIPTGGQ